MKYIIIIDIKLQASIKVGLSEPIRFAATPENKKIAIPHLAVINAHTETIKALCSAGITAKREKKILKIQRNTHISER